MLRAMSRLLTSLRHSVGFLPWCGQALRDDLCYIKPLYSTMPPKRAAKRAGSPDGDEAAKRPATKRSKSSTDATESTLYPWTNKGIPDSVKFPPAGDNNIRISAWNVAGLTACFKKVSACLVLKAG